MTCRPCEETRRAVVDAARALGRVDLAAAVEATTRAGTHLAEKVAAAHRRLAR